MSDVKSAYFRLAKRHHPDVFHKSAADSGLEGKDLEDLVDQNRRKFDVRNSSLRTEVHMMSSSTYAG